jgi:hypothetical protein
MAYQMTKSTKSTMVLIYFKNGIDKKNQNEYETGR